MANKYLDYDGLEYLVEKLKKQIADSSPDLSDYLTKSVADNTYLTKLTPGTGISISGSTISSSVTLSDLSGVSTVNASGSGKLSLSASKSGTTVSITGSVDLNDYVTATEFDTLKDKLNSLIGDSVSWITNDDYLLAFTDCEDNFIIGITKDGKLYTPLGGVYYTGEEIDNLLAEIVTGGQIDLSSYLTKTEASSTYQEKLNFYSESTAGVQTATIQASEVIITGTTDMILRAGTTLAISGNVAIGTTSTSNTATYNGKEIATVSDLDDYAKTSDLINYLTTAAASSTYQPLLNYYEEGNRLVYIGGKDDSEYSHFTREVIDLNGYIQLQVGSGTSAEHIVKLSYNGAFEYDDERILTESDIDGFAERTRVFTTTFLDMFDDAGPSVSNLYPEVSSLRKGDVIIGYLLMSNIMAVGVLGNSTTWATAHYISLRELQLQQQWLVTGYMLEDPSIPRSSLQPSTGTPEVGDILFGAGSSTAFRTATITGTDSNGYYLYSYLS